MNESSCVESEGERLRSVIGGSVSFYNFIFVHILIPNLTTKVTVSIVIVNVNMALQH